MRAFTKKATKYLVSVLIAYALLVTVHEGEFWPFSIYPMFSQAGNPWTRALVRNVSDVPEKQLWEVSNLDNLYGQPIALSEYGVDQIDFANFISKTENWDQGRLEAIPHMFGREHIRNQQLMIMSVRGRLTTQDSVVVQAFPVILVKADTTYLNPELIDISNIKSQ